MNASMIDPAAGRHRVLGLWLLVVLGSCGAPEPDAYGNFEADEVTVSAEVDGRLLRYDVREGAELDAGTTVGLIDTTQTVLQLRELRAQLASARSATGRAGSEAGALEAELATAERDLARTERLYEDEAATAQQLDAAQMRVEVLRARLAAARSGTRGSGEQVEAIQAQVARLEDRLARSRVTNPVAGAVLASYAEAGEFVRTGQALYQVAALDTLSLRAYVDGARLSDLRVGQRVIVRYDVGPDEREAVPGILSWVASEAEFTPTPIQTREERTELVYAVKIRVANPDRRLKIGMPADVEFAAPAADEREREE
ncbi:MAG TPA: HlyD family efflux transporter periplasmic adaptor subunit [Gemmatimonadota bacterium]|nr:HlyD family efflux transporter periplasmic adaptor subunit [Gemmatimonadota bacterium]